MIRHVHIATGPRAVAKCGVELASLDKSIWVSEANAPSWLTPDPLDSDIRPCEPCFADVLRPVGRAEEA